MSGYMIIDESGQETELDILDHFYGTLWPSTLDRVGHDTDGRVVTVHFQGNRYNVYRKEFAGGSFPLTDISDKCENIKN